MKFSDFPYYSSVNCVWSVGIVRAQRAAVVGSVRIPSFLGPGQMSQGISSSLPALLLPNSFSFLLIFTFAPICVFVSRTRVQIQSTLQKISSLNVHRHFSIFFNIISIFKKKVLLEKFRTFRKIHYFASKFTEFFKNLHIRPNFANFPILSQPFFISQFCMSKHK